MHIPWPRYYDTCPHTLYISVEICHHRGLFFGSAHHLGWWGKKHYSNAKLGFCRSRAGWNDHDTLELMRRKIFAMSMWQHGMWKVWDSSFFSRQIKKTLWLLSHIPARRLEHNFGYRLSAEPPAWSLQWEHSVSEVSLLYYGAFLQYHPKEGPKFIHTCQFSGPW